MRNVENRGVQGVSSRTAPGEGLSSDTRGSGAGGFTLIEILLAATLSAMIALGAYTYLEAARTLAARVEFKATLFQRERAILKIMERDLMGAFDSAQQGVDWGVEGTHSTQGDASTDTLQLVASNNRPRSETQKEQDLTRTIYTLDPQRGLVRQKIKFLTSITPPDLTAGDVLSSDVVGLALRYHDGTTWSTDWDSTSTMTMPKAIEITITVQATFKGNQETESLTSAVWLPFGQTYKAPSR